MESYQNLFYLNGLIHHAVTLTMKLKSVPKRDPQILNSGIRNSSALRAVGFPSGWLGPQRLTCRGHGGVPGPGSMRLGPDLATCRSTPAARRSRIPAAPRDRPAPVTLHRARCPTSARRSGARGAQWPPAASDISITRAVVSPPHGAGRCHPWWGASVNGAAASSATPPRTGL